MLVYKDYSHHVLLWALRKLCKARRSVDSCIGCSVVQWPLVPAGGRSGVTLGGAELGVTLMATQPRDTRTPHPTSYIHRYM